MSESEIKQQVQDFYNRVGWQQVSAGTYQNATYEDLRPVAREYIHRCHLRVARHLASTGNLLLDAGSGPIQYPEYLEYSHGYRHRVCLDISSVALQEARQRIGEHGLFVVGDIANLPFKSDAFDGLVSLHTIHHLPEEEHLQAYGEIHRLLAPGMKAVVVNGWPSSALMRKYEPLVRLSLRLRHILRRISGQSEPRPEGEASQKKKARQEKDETPKGTFTSRHDVAWMRSEVGSRMPVEIFVWRSASVRFLRNLVFPWLAGRYWLKLLYRLEERSPQQYGEIGQYPLIVIRKESHQESTEA